MRFVASCIFTFVIVAVNGQSVNFVVGERDVIPEGITIDPTNNTFYISSIHKNKIIRVKDGVASDFVQAGEFGFMGGVGLHVDAKRRILWACSGNILGNNMQAGLFAFSLKDGALLKKVTFPSDTVSRFFNDLTISTDGTVIVTDTFGHCLWKWSLTMDVPEKLILKGRLRYPNGIVEDPSGKYWYVAADDGLARVDRKSLRVEYLSGAVPLTGIDGMGWLGNSIYAVQNALGPGLDRLIRIQLDAAHKLEVKTIVIDQANTNFDVPTTLAVNQGKIYVLANSHLGQLDQATNRITDPSKLRGPTVLVYTGK